MKEAVRYGVDLNNNLDALLLAARLGDKAGIEKGMSETEKDIKNLIKHARAVAEACTDPALKKEINATCDELEAVLKELLKASADLVSNPQSVEARKKLEELVARAR